MCSLRSKARIIPLFLLLLLLNSRNGNAEVVKVAIPSTTQAVLPFMIARDKGYYRAEGLDVELILMSAPIASRALLSGDVAVATVGGLVFRRYCAVRPSSFFLRLTIGRCFGSTRSPRFATSKD